LDIYSASCECGQVYIGQTGRRIETRIKEHQRHTRLQQTEKSAVADHNINLGRRIKLQGTATLCTKAICIDRMIREAIEI
jgi:predicted GIY-YIG superfamily endonuclease